MLVIWRTNSINACIFRAEPNFAFRSFASKNPSVGLSEKPDPTKITCDYVGPFDPDSNIRQYVRHIAKDETPLKRKLREKQIEVENWLHDFWSKHNKAFFTEKQQFIEEHRLVGTEDDYQDKLSEFYKQFLDKNYKRHMDFNWAWYKKNFEILVLMFRVEVENFIKYIKRIRRKFFSIDKK